MRLFYKERAQMQSTAGAYEPLTHAVEDVQRWRYFPFAYNFLGQECSALGHALPQKTTYFSTKCEYCKYFAACAFILWTHHFYHLLTFDGPPFKFSESLNSSIGGLKVSHARGDSEEEWTRWYQRPLHLFIQSTSFPVTTLFGTVLCTKCWRRICARPKERSLR